MPHQTTKKPIESDPIDPQRSRATGWVLLGCGTMLASMVMSGFILGYWVDVWLDKNPVFMLLFGILGLAGGMLKVHKLLT